MDLGSIGRQFGLDEQQTRAAFDALAPVVAAGLRRNAQSDGGLTDLIGALTQGNHARYADEPAALEQPETIDDGNAMLGHIFGSKDVSRGVAREVSASTGLGESVLKKLLPVIAAMIMGQLAKSASGRAAPQGGGGGLGDILGGILGGGQQGGGGMGGGLGDILGSVLGGGAPRAQRPQSGGLDDILRDVLGGGTVEAPDSGEGAGRARRGLEDMLGGGTSRGTAADDLLNSIDRMVRRL